jgi:hypothetical protein
MDIRPSTGGFPDVALLLPRLRLGFFNSEFLFIYFLNANERTWKGKNTGPSHRITPGRKEQGQL